MRTSLQLLTIEWTATEKAQLLLYPEELFEAFLDTVYAA